MPERFVPSTMGGDFTAAEHLGRYTWAASFAAGRRVLDAGCGVGYGSRMLAEAGASAVTGVDLAEAVIDAAVPEMPEGVNLVQGDVRALAFPDDAFDLVVCFEVIEHVDDASRTLDELRRVLAPNGVLLISSPNRDAYVPGNPHHIHEFTPDELTAELSSRFRHVALRRQNAWVSAAILDDHAAAVDGLGGIEDVHVAKLAPVPPGQETYTLALAGDTELPPDRPVLVMTDTAEPRRWLELYDQQHDVLDRQRQHIDNMQRSDRELTEARARLREAEQQLARVPLLEQEISELVTRTEALTEALTEDAVAATHHANVKMDTMSNSLSWRITKPLRRLKRALR